MRGKTQTLDIDGIPVEIQRKSVKHLYLRVLPPDGRVCISAPKRASLSLLRETVQQRLGWIRRQQQRCRMHTPPDPLLYRPGEIHPLWGVPYRLEWLDIPGRPQLLVHPEQRLLMRLPLQHDRTRRKKLLADWYRAALAEAIPPLLARWEPVMEVKAEGWGIRDMKTRWGSCNTRERRIWLNLALAKYRPQCLEYVVVHELTHLLERNHTPRFHALMSQFLPDWQEIQAELNAPLPTSEPD